MTGGDHLISCLTKSYGGDIILADRPVGVREIVGQLYAVELGRSLLRPSETVRAAGNLGDEVRES
jgi:hypothetical protein